jgi:hypothetical protein
MCYFAAPVPDTIEQPVLIDSVYFDLWHASLTRDQAAFDAAMLRREDHPVRLSKQRGEGRLEFGGGEDSKYIVDFMGVACAIMARKRGMTCDIDTTYLPRAMVDMALDSPGAIVMVLPIECRGGGGGAAGS